VSTTLARLNVLIGADLSALEKGLQKSTKDLQKFSAKMSEIGSTLTTRVTLPIVGLGGAMFKLAADSAEAASKFETVFGDATQEVNHWVKELRKTVPQTTDEIQSFASQMQDLLVPLGMVPDKAKDMTKSVVELAADLASFNNVPMADTLAAIQSGLVGQTRPMLQYGIAIKAATVEAKALEMGLIRQGEELTSAARAQATFALMVEGSTFAMGDAERTAGSAANQLKFLWAEIKETGGAIGAVLMPVITPLISALREKIQLLGTLNPETVRWGIAIAAVAATLGPAALLVSQLATAVGFLAAALSVSLLPMVMVGGPILLGLAALSVWWVKGKLDAIAAAGAVDEYAISLGSLSEQTLQAAEAENLRQRTMLLAKPQTEAVRSALFELELELVKITDAHNKLRPAITAGATEPMQAAATAAADLSEELKELDERVRTAVPGIVNYGDGIRNSMTPAMQEAYRTSRWLADGLKRDLEAMGFHFEKMPPRAKKFADALDEIADAGDQLGKDLANNLADSLASGTFSLKKFVDFAMRELTRLAMKMAALKIFGAIFAPATGGASLGLAGGISIAGMAASGANVRAGENWIVGERGPEVFSPGVSGQVRPVVAGGDGDSGALAAALATRQRPLTPREAAQDQWWCEFVAEAMGIAGGRGLRLGGA